MAVSRKIQATTGKQPSIEELIMKGGTSGHLDAIAPADDDDKDFRRVQLRLPPAKLDEMDKIVRRRPGKLSRHTWIMEAIEEKLLRDSQL
jgi:hypothetical protein